MHAAAMPVTAAAARLYFALCMVTVSLSFVLYYVLGKYKLVFIGWLTCLGILAAFWTGRAVYLRFSLRAHWPILAFYAYLWLTALWAYDRQFTLYWVFLDMLYPAVFLLGLSWAQNLEPVKLSAYFELSVWLSTCLALYFLITSGSFVDPRFGAVRSGMAFTFITALPFLLWRAWVRPSAYRVALAGWVVTFVLLAASRSAFLILPVALLGSAYAWVKSTRRPVQSGLTVAVVGVAAFVIVLALPSTQAGIDRSMERFSPEQQSFDLSAEVLDEAENVQAGTIDIERRLQAFVALETFLQRPLLGDGYMNTYAKMKDRFDRDVSAHGLPFTLLGETGIIGTLLFIALLWPFFARTRAAARSAVSVEERSFYRTLRVAMTVMLVFGLFHQLHQTPSFFIALAWGYALPSARVQRRAARLAVAPAAEPIPQPSI